MHFNSVYIIIYLCDILRMYHLDRFIALLTQVKDSYPKV